MIPVFGLNECLLIPFGIERWRQILRSCENGYFRAPSLMIDEAFGNDRATELISFVGFRFLSMIGSIQLGSH